MNLSAKEVTNFQRRIKLIFHCQKTFFFHPMFFLRWKILIFFKFLLQECLSMIIIVFIPSARETKLIIAATVFWVTELS